MSEETKESSAGDDARDSTSLSQLFDDAFALFNSINKTEAATNSLKVQVDIKRAMTMFEDATRLVSIVDMFSENESFEEVATENIKYFLLPALLGTLVTKLCGSHDRMHIINVAEIYFLDFLKRVKSYGLTDIQLPEIKVSEDGKETGSERARSNAELITEMVTKRNTKLQRYKDQKELESRLNALSESLENTNIDDEVKRDYFVTLVKSYVNQALDELSSIATERPILEHMKTMGKEETMASQELHRHRPAPLKLQPIIITRDQVQKKVYGAGYPSLPVLTVEEFYEQRVKDGDWPDASQRNQMNAQSLQSMAENADDDIDDEDPEILEKERQIEEDDPELLEQMRAMDEYKDTHRRGWGNRANRS